MQQRARGQDNRPASEHRDELQARGKALLLLFAHRALDGNAGVGRQFGH